MRSAISVEVESMELFPIHSDEHIKGFAQEVAAAHAGVKYGEAGEIEGRRGI